MTTAAKQCVVNNSRICISCVYFDGHECAESTCCCGTEAEKPPSVGARIPKSRGAARDYIFNGETSALYRRRRQRNEDE
jgi:hypothetical protein